MADHHVREIQLGGKQLVFLFVASVGLAVVVFLLGVSVGRGVRERTGVEMPAADEPLEPVTAENMPPPTEITPEQQAILGTLAESSPQAVAPVPGASPPSTPVAEPNTEDEPVDEPPIAPVDQPAVGPERAVTPAPAPAARPPSPPPAPRGEWSVQTGAYRSRETADREAAGLVDRGFAAYVDASVGTGLFRVRIGPFEQRTQADEVAARLRQQGVQPLVTR